jgi:predicted regulator of Ras-like GTPase activity (Roadblock/LC7/MglB family)
MGKMAALSSSLLSVGEAVVSTLVSENAGLGGLDIMTMEANGIQVVSTRIHRPDGYLILMAAAKAPLGVVLVGVKATADEVRKLL